MSKLIRLVLIPAIKYYRIFGDESSKDGSKNNGNSDGNSGGDSGNSGGNSGGNNTPPRVFTQEEVNKFLAEDRRKNKGQTEKLIQDLEQLKQSKGLSDKERQELSNKIEELNQQVMTKEQLLEKEKARLSNEHKVAKDLVEKERDNWKNRYTEATIIRAITDAAVEAESYSPEQIVAILERRTKLVEDIDSDGNPTGIYNPRVKFDDVDKEGKPVILDLSVKEAVKRMKDLSDKYGNLFKSGVAGGLGGTGSKGTAKTKDFSKMSIEEYRKWRKDNPGLDIRKRG